MAVKQVINAHIGLNHQEHQKQVELLEKSLGHELPSYEDGDMFLYAMREGQDRYIQTTYYEKGSDGKSHQYNVTYSTKGNSYATDSSNNIVGVLLGNDEPITVHEINYQVTQAQLDSTMLLLGLMETDKGSLLAAGLDVFASKIGF